MPKVKDLLKEFSNNCIFLELDGHTVSKLKNLVNSQKYQESRAMLDRLMDKILSDEQVLLLKKLEDIVFQLAFETEHDRKNTKL